MVKKCIFFELNKCKKGDACHHSHVVCRNFLKGKFCKHGKDCTYVHPVSTKTGDIMVVEDCDLISSGY
jgi:hypothetical protein